MENVTTQSVPKHPLRARLGFFALLLALLLVFSAATDALARKHAAQLADGASRSMLAKMEPEETVDVLVMGDSESYTSVSPLQLYLDYGWSVYDAGQPQQKVEAAYVLLSQLLKRQSPKAVLLETNQFFLYEGVVAELRDTLAEEANRLPLFAYHSAWKTLIDPPLPVQHPIRRGFTVRTDILTSGYSPDYMHVGQTVETIHPMTAWYIRRIKALCDREGTALIFYTSVSPAFFNLARRDAVAALAAELDVWYVDMNSIPEELGINWETDMLDAGDHVNFYGAQRITRYLGEMLDAGLDIPDHRGDPAYAALAAEAEAYAAEAAAAEAMLSPSP